MILMDVLTQISTFLVNMLAGETEFFSRGMAYLGAGIAVFTGVGPAIGEGMVAAKAMEAMGRQPEAINRILKPMLIGQAVCETTGLYGLIIAFVLVGK